MTDVKEQGNPGDIEVAWDGLVEALDQLEDDLDELAERRDLVGGIASRAMISNSVAALEVAVEDVQDRLDALAEALNIETKEDEDG